METNATDLFWYLCESRAKVFFPAEPTPPSSPPAGFAPATVTSPALPERRSTWQIQPETGSRTFKQTFTSKEAEWDRFKTVQGVTGRMMSDYTLVPTPAEEDLDVIGDAEIAPKYHAEVLRDAKMDLTWSGEASALRERIERGKLSKTVRGGEAKSYGRNFIRSQFRSLDLSRHKMRALNVPYTLTSLDKRFATELPNLEEISLSGQALVKVRQAPSHADRCGAPPPHLTPVPPAQIENLPPRVISVNAHCNSISTWPTLPNFDIRSLGLSGNSIASLDVSRPAPARRQLPRLGTLHARGRK